MVFRLRYAAISDVGRVRKDNQDSGYAGPWLLAVCDGVGGAARGDLASATAIGQLRKIDAKPTTSASDDMRGQVAGALHRANDRIAELVDDDPSLSGTSTTATLALFDGAKLTFGHVGDSRAYLFRAEEIRQITKDHTFVQSLIDEGRITDEDARTHPHRNLILKAIDGVHDIDADLFDVELLLGDRLLLCSDGASGVLDDGRLADILSMGTPDYAAVELVRASLEAGTNDNVTCIVADVVEEADVAPDQQQPMLVGAAADLKRRLHVPRAQPLPRAPRRRHRRARARARGDPRLGAAVRHRDRPGRPRGGALRPPAAAPVPVRAPPAGRRRGARPGVDGRRGGVLLEPEAVLRRRAGRQRDHLPRSQRRRPRHRPVPPLRDLQRQPRPALATTTSRPSATASTPTA